MSGEDTRQRVNGSCRPLTAAALCRVFWFAECPTLGKSPFCRVLLFAECSALGKPPLCRVPVVCRVLSRWHSANSLFAECPIKCTRQSLGHLAKKSSPVVYISSGKSMLFLPQPYFRCGSYQLNEKSVHQSNEKAKQQGGFQTLHLLGALNACSGARRSSLSRIHI